MTGRLPDAAARERITTALDQTLFVQAGAGSGKTESLVDRVVSLIDAGVAMRAIAAITFTEKAAAELRDRIRRVLEERHRQVDEPGDRRRYQTALEQVDAAAISTLHAFAQRILTEHAIEAALPPNVEVLDEVASQLEFEQRWLRFRDTLLDAPDLARWLLLGFAVGIDLEDARHLATVFGANWDLLADPERLPWPRTDPPVVDVSGLLTGLDALLRRRSECRTGDDRLLAYLNDEIEPFVQRLRAAPDDFETLRLLREDRPSFRCSQGKGVSWTDKAAVVGALHALREQRSRLATALAEACVRRLAVEVASFTLDAAAQRRTSGRLEFHDLLVLARDLLRGRNGVEVRRQLRRRYQRLLLDEFQDTDPIQMELAVLITSDDPNAGAKPWQQVPVEAGRLFFVGDPKQSIYRFRRADIDLFLRAGAIFGQPPVSLTTNFRTTPAVIDWVNAVFAELIKATPGSQPAYEPLNPAPQRTPPPDGHPVVLLGQTPHADDVKADGIRELEAAEVAAAVQTALTWQVSFRDRDGREQWRPAKLGDITILLPARTSLPALERALDERGIPYRAETSSLVYSTREVRDLLGAVRALADPTDQLALVAALRSPVFGCGDDDLFTYAVEHGGQWSFLAPTPVTVAADNPVAESTAYLRELHGQLPWLSPSEVLQTIAADRRLFELAYAQGRPRDLWRRLRFVIDQARAWSEAEGGTLREYLEWARLQASDSARVAEAVLPETDDDSVRVLTIHGSKGLEFPVTILSGMTSQAGGRPTRVEVGFPPRGAIALKVGRSVATAEFEAFQPIDEQMSYHERLRLLYVACTRAKDHLVVSLHRKTRKKPPTDPARRTNAELIADACAGAPSQRYPAAAADSGRLRQRREIPPPPTLDLDEWEAERAAALAAGAARRSVGASDVELATDDDLDDEAVAGIDKGARDLELPPWQKGRYGTAVGRAVHAVLQTVDLATGEGLDDAAAAQAAAEAVVGRTDDIRRLARAALDTPSVREAVTRSRWRETYVATPVGNRTLEGYIDLLYRGEAGLVVVDYKTAAASADLDRRLADYRGQGGAYAIAVEQATGERVERVVFVFLTAQGAIERELPDLDGAKAAVLQAVAS